MKHKLIRSKSGLLAIRLSVEVTAKQEADIREMLDWHAKRTEPELRQGVSDILGIEKRIKK